MDVSQIKGRIKILSYVLGAASISLTLLTVVGIGRAQTPLADALPTPTTLAATSVMTTTRTTLFTASMSTTVTPAISGTLAPLMTPTLLATATPIVAEVVTLPETLPMPPQLNCGPRLGPCTCPTPTLQYVFPVQPPEVADYGPAHHDYPAADIFAPYRSVVVAVTNGVIDELSYDDNWDPAVDDPALRSGRYVTIVGDDGVRYHGSHLDELALGLAPGNRVFAGQVLGYVGSSGNARGIAPHLHFGISYPTFAGDWEGRRGMLSPYPYLQAWAQHEQITPDLSSLPRP